MMDYWIWVLVAAAPGLLAIAMLAHRGQWQDEQDAERDAQLEELSGLSRSVVDAEIDVLRRKLADLDSGQRAKLAQLEAEVEGLRRWIAALLSQMRDAGMTPVPAPVVKPPNGVVGDPAVAPARATAARVTALQQKMVAHFSLEELDDLAFQMGVDGETVWSGAATLRTRARALLRFAARHERLDELVELCHELRPSIDW